MENKKTDWAMKSSYEKIAPIDRIITNLIRRYDKKKTMLIKKDESKRAIYYHG